MMDIDEIIELLEDVVFRPFGQAPWSLLAEELEDGVKLILENHFARDSSAFDPWSEGDDWTMMDGKTQHFSMSFGWIETETELRKSIAELIAYAMAHESLEWSWWGRERLYDPHENGDVIVKL